MKINNRIVHNTVESDVVYPDLNSTDRKLKRVCIVEPQYVVSLLRMYFDRKVNRINNKYVIYVEDGIYLYQHDHKTWLVQQT